MNLLMTHRFRLAGFVVLLLAGARATTGWAQTVGPASPYYITAGSTNAIYVIQGGGIVASFPTVTIAGGGNYEYPIAVYGSTLRTTNGVSGLLGYEYTLSGTPTGPSYVLPSPIGSAWDATTDGSHNYLLDFTNGIVYQTGLDYSNPVALFSGLGSSASLGITFDPTNNSLWVSGWTTNQVIDFAMNGTQLSSFPAAVTSSSLVSLALDPATGTLWMGTQSTGIFYQYSKSGVLLQTITIPTLAGLDILGGEFAFTAIPESTPLTLLPLGVLTLVGFRRWRRI